MKSRTSKLTTVLVVTLLFASAVTIAGSQPAGSQRPVDLNLLAARGEALANADPLSAELRNQQPEGPVRRGFDIGMAAAQRQTALDSRIARVRDLLSAAEQEGFTTAVSFSLARNQQKIPDLAPTDPAPKREASANQEPRYRELSQPENTVWIEVRYPTAYGYKNAKGLFDPGPNSCDVFSVTATPATAGRQRESRQPPELILTSKQPKMRKSNGVYVCDYLIYYLPLDQPINVRVAVGSEREPSTEAWIGGSEAQPAQGQHRAIKAGTRTVMLSANRPRVSLTFDMTYSGVPSESAIATPVATEVGGATIEALRGAITQEPPICASARSARARNSPAALGLEAQCRAAGGILPDPPICGNARSARARNSPAARGLEAQCRAAGGIL